MASDLDEKARCRIACQTLLTELVSIGPESVESAAERAAQEIRRLRAEVESARKEGRREALEYAALICDQHAEGHTRLAEQQDFVEVARIAVGMSQAAKKLAAEMRIAIKWAGLLPEAEG